MNTDNPIFKIHKIQHFVTICEKSFFFFNIQFSLAKPLYYWSNWLKKQIYAEMNTLPVWHWLLWGKMLKFTPLLNANSC